MRTGIRAVPLQKKGIDGCLSTGLIVPEPRGGLAGLSMLDVGGQPWTVNTHDGPQARRAQAIWDIGIRVAEGLSSSVRERDFLYICWLPVRHSEMRAIRPPLGYKSLKGLRHAICAPVYPAFLRRRESVALRCADRPGKLINCATCPEPLRIELRNRARKRVVLGTLSSFEQQGVRSSSMETGLTSQFEGFATASVITNVSFSSRLAWSPHLTEGRRFGQLWVGILGGESLLSTKGS